MTGFWAVCVLINLLGITYGPPEWSWISCIGAVCTITMLIYSIKNESAD